MSDRVRRNGEHDVATEKCECFPGYTGRLCDIKCPGCDGAHGTCSLTPVSENSGREDTGTYAIIDTMCACEEWWMGGNCTIPCPCARGGFARGTCAIDTEKQQALGTTTPPDEEDWECACVNRDTWERTALFLVRRARRTKGDCVPPPGLEDGIGGRSTSSSWIPRSERTRYARRRWRTYAKGVGLCECRVSESNYLGGLGFTGADCSTVCYPCDKGTCQSDGSCECLPGYGGARCDRECAGHGVMIFPTFNETYNETVFDVLPGVPGNDNMLNSGLFDVEELYGMKDLNTTKAYCACGYMRSVAGDVVRMNDNQVGINPLGGVGWTGVFCEVPCAQCNPDKGQCTYDGTEGKCDCFMDLLSGAKSTSALLDPTDSGLGYTGPACEIPCQPCYNGTCSNEPGSYGECLCNPGYSDAACLIECGSPDKVKTLLGDMYVGSGVKST